jgi:hypothetical protein
VNRWTALTACTAMICCTAVVIARPELAVQAVSAAGSVLFVIVLLLLL